MRVSGRERIVLVLGGCLAGVLLLYLFAIDPALKRTRELDRLIPQKERELAELRLLHKEMDSLKGMRALMIQKIPGNERNLPPLAKLDGWIEQSGLRSQVRSIKPAPASGGGAEALTVELQLEKADLPQLTRFLFEIQSGGGARIARMGVKPRYTTPRFMDVSLQMIFYQG
jgi:type II secretory pathway component PulM